MNDFSELENELRTLRPARPSPVLLERVEEAMADCRASVSDATGRRGWYWRFTETPYKFGIGLAAAAAAALLLLARINTDQTQREDKEIAQVSPPSETTQVLPGTARLGGRAPVRGGSEVESSTSLNKFIPAAATQVVYNERDEGLQFTDSSKQPLRRLRYQTRQTWQWRNPTTGASLRVSYPSEEVVLIPVSGQ
jgi:hypothetical protein